MMHTAFSIIQERSLRDMPILMDTQGLIKLTDKEFNDLVAFVYKNTVSI